jgi:hypothetical protein
MFYLCARLDVQHHQDKLMEESEINKSKTRRQLANSEHLSTQPIPCVIFATASTVINTFAAKNP